jgi:predicted GIY-YIG superfamily endonuclease
MEQIYILELINNKYYIGKTNDVMRRYDEHMNNIGSAWTRLYKPIKLIECHSVKTVYDEDNITKDYMKKYGIENVRGGSYCQNILPKDTLSTLQREFQSSADLCYNCNKSGHFIMNCPNKIIEKNKVYECDYCDRTFETEYGCGVHERSCKKYNKPKNIVYGCNYCDRTFETEYGCGVHERSCKILNKPISQNNYNKKASSGACYRCGRSNHYSPDCYAKTDIDGNMIDDDD